MSDEKPLTIKSEEKPIKPDEKPLKCGCRYMCFVEIRLPKSVAKIHSLQHVAAMNYSKRKNLFFDEKQLYLWSQYAETDMCDKTKAIYDFHKCSGILAYASKFEGGWKEAAEKVREKLNYAIDNPEIVFVQVYNNMVNENTFRINVKSWETIREIKETISWRCGYPPDQQEFIFMGHGTDDTHTAEDNSITVGTTISIYTGKVKF